MRREVGHRPAPAAYPAGLPVGRERRVVRFVKRTRVGEQPAHEDHHRRQTHHLRHRQLERLESESLLDDVAGLRDPQPKPMAGGRPLHDERPEPPQDRVGHQGHEQIGRPVSEGGQAVAVDDTSFLPGLIRSRGVELDMLEMRGLRCAHRHRHARPATAVGIDHEVHRRASHLPGVGIEHRVFEPDAGMK